MVYTDNSIMVYSPLPIKVIVESEANTGEVAGFLHSLADYIIAKKQEDDYKRKMEEEWHSFHSTWWNSETYRKNKFGED